MSSRLVEAPLRRKPRLFGPYVLLGEPMGARPRSGDPNPCLAFRADAKGGRLCRLTRGSALESEDERLRWRGWAEKLLSLDHPHIVRTWAAGEQDQAEGPCVPFWEEELVDGRDLGALVARLAEQRTPLRPPLALLVARDIAEALTHAEDTEGLAHGDICAPHILVTYDGQAKLTGWQPPDAGASSRGGVADVKRLAVLLWELLAHRPAPPRELVSEGWPKPSQFNPDVPSAVDRLILATLQRGEEELAGAAYQLRLELDRILIVPRQAREELVRLMQAFPPQASAAQQAAWAAEVEPWLVSTPEPGPAGAGTKEIVPTVRLPLSDEGLLSPRSAAAPNVRPSSAPTALAFSRRATPSPSLTPSSSSRHKAWRAAGLGLLVAGLASGGLAIRRANDEPPPLASVAHVPVPIRVEPMPRPAAPAARASATASTAAASSPEPVLARRESPPATDEGPAPEGTALLGGTSASRDARVAARARACCGPSPDRFAERSPERSAPPPPTRASVAPSPFVVPSWSGLLQRGQAALEAGELEEAVRAAREALTRGAGAEGHSLLGQSFFAQHRYAAAASELRAALALDPADARARRRLRWLEASGKLPSAPVGEDGVAGLPARAPSPALPGSASDNAP